MLKTKNMTFTRYSVCVCGGGSQDVTSTMTPLSAVSTGVGGWGRGYECACWFMRALNNNGNERRR